MMKRILLVLLALSLAVSMSACGLTETIKTGITEGVENALAQLGDAVHFAPGAKLLREETDDVITDADGNQTLTHTVTRYEYDANDNQTLMETTVTDENGAVSVSRVESKYDAQGQPIETKSVNEDGSYYLTVYTNDENGRATEIREEDSNGYTCTRTYTYDENGNEIRSTYTDSDGAATETVTAYNDRGYAIHSEVSGKNGDGSDAGFISDYEYDAEDRMVKNANKSASGDGETTVLEYDANGNLTKEIFESGEIRSERVSIFDEKGNEVEFRITDQDGKVYRTTKEYDAKGNCTKTVYDGEFQYVSRFLYDADGREVYNRYDARYPDLQPAHTYSVSVTAYDAMGNEASFSSFSSDGSGYSCNNTYDAFGNLLKMNNTSIGEDGSSQSTVKTYTYEALKPEG